MTIFDFLNLLGGLCLFLFGMNLMGEALERRAGGKLKSLIGKITSGKGAGFLTGLGVTAIIQSSSATTVMVVGFVNSGLMTLKQAINVIMGANVGTTVTSWILSLGGIDSNNVFVKMLKPSSFTPILALIGIIFYMFFKSSKKKDTGCILLGFATLMVGMESMTAAVSGLSNVPAFKNMFLMFKNPVVGVLVGALLTAIIQSSSASVGILQALSATGQVSYGAAIPIIMGQNIGTCITAVLSSIGANKNAKRAAFVHLSFNFIGSVILITVFMLVKVLLAPVILNQAATLYGIAIVHSTFNILCVCILMPFSSLLEKLANKIIKEGKPEEEDVETLDERLLSTPTLALEQCRNTVLKMAKQSKTALKNSLQIFVNYSEQEAQKIQKCEQKCDKYEDIIGTYLIKLSSERLEQNESEQSAELLKIIGDFERISDHAVNITKNAEELRNKNLTLTEEAAIEYENIANALNEIADLTFSAFKNNDIKKAIKVEPLEQVIDKLKEKMRSQHIIRMQKGECSIETGFIWSDLLTNLERISDHCSNIAGCIIDTKNHNLNLHETLNATKQKSKTFSANFKAFSEKYGI